MAEKKQPESEHSTRLWDIVTDLIDLRREVAASSVDPLERALKIKEIQDAMDAVQLAIEDEDQFAEMEHKDAELSEAMAAGRERVARYRAENPD